MAGADVHAELAEAGCLNRTQAVDQLRTGAGEGEGPNDVGGDDLLLLGTQEHQMTAMIRKIAGIRGLIVAIDRAVGIELGFELGRRGKAEGAEFSLLGSVVKEDCGGGTRLR